jgi:hypothetical protein
LALHLGRVQSQYGIKMLVRRSACYSGPVYELKAAGPFRALVLQVNGEWQIIEIVHKDEFDRAVSLVAPLTETL